MTSGGLLSYTEAEIPGLAECVTFLDWDRHQTNPEDHKDNMTCALLLAFWLQTGNMGRLLDRGSGMLQRLTRAPFDRFLIPEFYKCAAAGGRETFDFLVNECRAIWVSRNPAEMLIPPLSMTSEQEESFAEATGLPAPPPPLVVQNLFPFHGSAPSPFDLFRGNFPDVLHFCAAAGLTERLQEWWEAVRPYVHVHDRRLQLDEVLETAVHYGRIEVLEWARDVFMPSLPPKAPPLSPNSKTAYEAGLHQLGMQGVVLPFDQMH